MTAARRSSPAIERVLAARLSDARFFWEQDLKVPLEELVKKIEQMVFHERIGTCRQGRAGCQARTAVGEKWVVTGRDPREA